MELKEFTEKMDAVGAASIQAITELKTALQTEIEEIKTKGTVSSETKEKIDRIETRLDQLSADFKRPDFNHQPAHEKSMGEQFVESEDFKAAKAADFGPLRHKDGRMRMALTNPFAGRKATITTVGLGTGTTGVQMPYRLPGVTGLPMQETRIRDLMGRPLPMTTGNSFDYVRMLTRSNSPSPQVEAAAKSESTYTWESKSDTIKTIAHWTNVSRQAIEDVPWLQNMIDGELRYGLLVKEEAEILAGDGTGQHLKGLITNATAYNTGLNVSGDTQLDKLRHAKLQARLVGLGTFAPDGVVLNPTDMAKIELIKDEAGGANKGRYIIGDPTQGTVVKFVWGLPVVESDSIAAGTFLLGAFSTAAQLIDRLAAMVELSYENASNFTSNLVTVLCEERLGMAVRRPEAFITGSI
jgi:HK97 family phage major capsid protein